MQICNVVDAFAFVISEFKKRRREWQRQRYKINDLVGWIRENNRAARFLVQFLT